MVAGTVVSPLLAISAFLAVFPVSAQFMPDLPTPTAYPDLQSDGEWWFYKLLDSQFPHDVVQQLPITAVSQQGLQFLDLPQAQYVLLEMFAPWCPHCQHFAPELAKIAKLLQSPQAQNGGIVAITAVDCEKLELRRYCDWGEAHMYPKIVLARREVLMGALGPIAKQTPGVSELFPVSKVNDVMTFLRQNVPELPADLPEPEARDKDAPFFGWSQIPEGVVEPPQVPLQDVVVGITSLLHSAFSKMNFDADAKNALFDLLSLLCVAGPGATCRQSVCNMRDGLMSEWDSLMSQATIKQDPEGNPITPFTVSHMDWARVEHEYKFCNRPWPDFAAESWDWCQGRTPGTRGFTCGLWLVFHSLLVSTEGRADVPQTLGKMPLDVIRTTVQHFFGCQDCRDHFLAVPVSPADTATVEAQMLWLWDAHNQATIRIGQLEREHSPTSPPRLPWPTTASCPQCFDASGGYVRPEVSNQLRRFYGNVFGDEGSQSAFLGGTQQKFSLFGTGAPQQPAVGPVGVVSVEVYYFTLCPHCQYFLENGLYPLVEARLPGDKVKVTLLPVYPPLLTKVGKPTECRAFDACRNALAPLCAFGSEGLKPLGGDTDLLSQGTAFSVCDIRRTAYGMDQTPEWITSCAAAAGIVPGDVLACESAPQSMELLREAVASLQLAMERLHDGQGFQEPPSMPWVFVDGMLLDCMGKGARCTAKLTSKGQEALSKPGTPLEIVCGKLSPMPEACTKALKRQAEDLGVVADPKACDNCNEVGSFMWTDAYGEQGRRDRSHPALALAVGGVALVVVAFGFTRWRCTTSTGPAE